MLHNFEKIETTYIQTNIMSNMDHHSMIHFYCSYDLINEARQKLGLDSAVTYQLIDGVLYRSKKCPFPARCQGVEHFILKLAPKLSNFELVLNTYDWPHISR